LGGKQQDARYRKGLSGLASALACLVVFVAIFYALMFVGMDERRFALYLTGGPGAGAHDSPQFSATSRD